MILLSGDCEFLILPSKVMRGLAQKYPSLNARLRALIGERLSMMELPRGTGFDQQLLRDLRASKPDTETEQAAA